MDLGSPWETIWDTDAYTDWISIQPSKADNAASDDKQEEAATNDPTGGIECASADLVARTFSPFEFDAARAGIPPLGQPPPHYESDEEDDDDLGHPPPMLI